MPKLMQAMRRIHPVKFTFQRYIREHKIWPKLLKPSQSLLARAAGRHHLVAQFCHIGGNTRPIGVFSFNDENTNAFQTTHDNE